MDGASGSRLFQRGGGVEANCAPLLSFLCATAVLGSAIPFATAKLEVIALDKELEAQRMEILRKGSPRAL